MQIRQFEDKNLSHYSYAIVNDSENKMVLIDPTRNVHQYLKYAMELNARIIGVIETHPHADFVSGHLELVQSTGATIYASKLINASYPHSGFDGGDVLEFGKIKLSAINTPGHSPDSISVLLEYDGIQKAIFTGDTLFIGDCGRPDLRESAGNIQVSRQILAQQMYHSLRDKLEILPGDVIVYPAHGAGTLCGKNLSKDSNSTIAKEKQSNWSLQEATEEEFVKSLLADQPFVPQYFPFDVELNRKGVLPLQEALNKIPTGKVVNENSIPLLDNSVWIIDTRREELFKKGHLPHSINLMEEGKFETWLGTIIPPNEKFYLACETGKQLTNMLERVAAIGYESQVAEGFIIENGDFKEPKIDLAKFREHTEDYTIIDVRNSSEVKQGKIFENSIHIPLSEIRNRIGEIPLDKPIVVHCAGGYRSAAASSLLQSILNKQAKVFDLGEAIRDFN